MTIPNATPDIAFGMAIDDLYSEAANFIDGADLATEGQATAIAKIRDDAKALAADVEAKRKELKKPHDDAGAAVQATYKPLQARLDDIIKAVQKSLTAWLQAQEDETRRIADEARAEADRLAAAALEAKGDSLTDMTAARELQDQAADAIKAAKRAEKAPANISGGGRAFGLRTYRTVTLTDSAAAFKWARETHPELLREWLRELAQRIANAGPCQIPGFTIEEQRKVA